MTGSPAPRQFLLSVQLDGRQPYRAADRTGSLSFIQEHVLHVEKIAAEIRALPDDPRQSSLDEVEGRCLQIRSHLQQGQLADAHAVSNELMLLCAKLNNLVSVPLAEKAARQREGGKKSAKDINARREVVQAPVRAAAREYAAAYFVRHPSAAVTQAWRDRPQNLRKVPLRTFQGWVKAPKK